MAIMLMDIKLEKRAFMNILHLFNTMIMRNALVVAEKDTAILSVRYSQKQCSSSVLFDKEQKGEYRL